MTSAQHHLQAGPVPPVVKFVEVSCACQTVCSHQLHQIRSHVAKTAHSRRRQKKAAVALSLRENRDQVQELHLADDSSIDNDGGDRPTALRKIRPTPRASKVPYLASTSIVKAPIARTSLSSESFAWNISKDERFLFTFYFDWVLQYGYRGCVPERNAQRHQDAMRDVYVPFAVSHPALLAGILFVASRRYATMASNASTAAVVRYHEKTLQYKFLCLETAKAAVASETLSSDVTVALTLVLASEAYWEGDMSSFRIHGNALMKMAAMRTNLSPSTVSSLLLYLIRTSVYNPSFRFVDGPLLPS